MNKIKIEKVKPMISHHFNRPIPGVTWEQFWAVWDKLMDQGKFKEATIFVVERYNHKWNKGKS